MPTPFESAQLILKLFEIRRDPVLREARQWFLSDFNPVTWEECSAIIGGERNSSFRMVVGYWDMAASLVTHGAIDTELWHRTSMDGRTEGYVWLAPSLRYIPIKMRVTRTSRGTLEVLLDSIRVDDAKSFGLPEELVAAVSIAILAEQVPEALTGEQNLERALRKLRRPGVRRKLAEYLN